MSRRWIPGVALGAALGALGLFGAMAGTSDTTLQGNDSLRVICNGVILNIETGPADKLTVWVAASVLSDSPLPAGLPGSAVETVAVVGTSVVKRTSATPGPP